jgi:hypothetical protein
MGIFNQPGKNEFFNRFFRYDPSGEVRPSLQKGNKKVPLRGNPDQISLFRLAGRRVDFGWSISYKI